MIRALLLLAGAPLGGGCGGPAPLVLPERVFEGEMTAAAWFGDGGCEVTAPIVGATYAGDCDGCTYAFTVELQVEADPCQPTPLWWPDRTGTSNTFVLAFDPELWYYVDAYEHFYWHRVEEAVKVCDRSPVGGCPGANDWDLLASNALDDAAVSFDGTTLEASYRRPDTDGVLVTDHLWDVCEVEASVGTSGVEAIPGDAQVVDVACPGELREWRYTLSVEGATQLAAAAVESASAESRPATYVYLVDPDGCVVAMGESTEECPKGGDACAAIATAATMDGAWSVVVAVDECSGREPASFAVWATLDGEAVPLTAAEEGHPVETEETVDSGVSWSMRATLTLPEPATADVFGCDLAPMATDLAGEGAVDCGVVPPWGDRTAVDACTVASQSTGQRFVALYEHAGIYAGSTTALVGAGDGLWILSAVRSDDHPDGPASILETHCAAPIVGRGGGGEDVVECPASPYETCYCTRDACSEEACCPSGE